MSDDILHNYDQLFTGPSSMSSDALVGSTGSYTNFHQDAPLRCSSLLVVLKVS